MRPDTRLLVQLCLGITICVSNGAVFIFGIFSPQLRGEPFNFTQSEVATIATCGAVACYISLPSGLLYDRCGPRAVMLVGAAASLIGWLGFGYIFWSVRGSTDFSGPESSPAGFWLEDPLPFVPIISFFSSSVFSTSDGDASQLSALEPSPSSARPAFLAACLFFSFALFSSPFLEHGSVLSNIQAIATFKGDVVLVQKTFIGLGSSVVALIYAAFFASSDGGASAAAAGTSGGIEEDVRAAVSGCHRMAGFCVFMALIGSLPGITGALFYRLPLIERCEGDQSAVDACDDDVARSSSSSSSSSSSALEAASCCSPSSLIGTPSCPRVVGLNSVTSQAVSNSSSSTSSHSVILEKSELDVGAVLYGPFFKAARHLTYTAIFFVTLVTAINALWDPPAAAPSSSEYVFYQLWQRTSLFLLLCICFVAFFGLVWIFKPHRPFSDQHQRCEKRNPEELSAIVTDRELQLSGCPAMCCDIAKKESPRAPPALTPVGKGVEVDMAISVTSSTSAAVTCVFPSLDEDAVDMSNTKLHAQQFDSRRHRRRKLLPVAALTQNTKSLRENITTDPQHLFLLLAFRSLVIMGVTVLVSSNSSQIYYALTAASGGYTAAGSMAMVSVFGVANAVGRMLSGQLDTWIRKEAADNDGHVRKEGGGTVGPADCGTDFTPHIVHSSSAESTMGHGHGHHVTISDELVASLRCECRASRVLPRIFDKIYSTQRKTHHPLGCLSSEAADSVSPSPQLRASSHRTPSSSSRGRRAVIAVLDAILRVVTSLPPAPEGESQFAEPRQEDETDKEGQGDAAEENANTRKPNVARGTEANNSMPSATRIASANSTLSIAPSPQRRWNVLHLSILPHIALLAAFPLFCVLPGNALSLAIPFALVGLAAGLLWGGMLLTAASVYSPAHVGSHYGAVGVSGMLAPVLFNVFLFGRPYDAAAARQQREQLSSYLGENVYLNTTGGGHSDSDSLLTGGQGDEAQWCVGLSCVATPFAWCFAANFAALCACILLCRLASRRGSM